MSFVVLLLWIPLRERARHRHHRQRPRRRVRRRRHPGRPRPSGRPGRRGRADGRQASLLCGFATALYIGAQLGRGPRDGLMTGLHRRTGLSLRLVRTGLEVAVVLLGLLLGRRPRDRDRPLRARHRTDRPGAHAAPGRRRRRPSRSLSRRGQDVVAARSTTPAAARTQHHRRARRPAWVLSPQRSRAGPHPNSWWRNDEHVRRSRCRADAARATRPGGHPDGAGSAGGGPGDPGAEDGTSGLGRGDPAARRQGRGLHDRAQLDRRPAARSSPPRPRTSAPWATPTSARPPRRPTGCSSKPVTALKEGGLAEGSAVGKTLLELRRTVEDLDPSQATGRASAGSTCCPSATRSPTTSASTSPRRPSSTGSCTACATARTS